VNIRNRRTIFKGPIIDIEQMDVEIGTGGSHTFQVVRHPGGAGVLPVHEDGTISLIRQLRPAVAAHLLEIPAGRLGPGEVPLDCARRELEEETGMTAATFIPLGMIHSSPGVFDEIIHLFAAYGISRGEARPESDEEIEVVSLTLDEALLMSLDGRISDAKTLAALHRCEMLRRFGKGHA
jgi:ADP-ribose pyrophosphatase